MSAFEVVVTPTRSKCKKRVESREPTDVVMAPFSAKSIVQFEDVPIGKTARRILRIVNPSTEDIEVRVIRAIDAEYNISINWTETTVPRSKTVEMEMVWSPLVDVACKEIMQLLDNRNFRKDVMVIMKTRIANPVKTVRKFPTISTSNNGYVRTLRLKSPTGTSKSHKANSTHTQLRKSVPTIIQKPVKPQTAPSTSHTRAPAPRSAWVDSNSKLRKEQKREAFDEITINFTHTSPLTEQNIYARSKTMNATITSISSTKSPVLITHKENVSPLTPNNVIEMFDNIQFTPINSDAVKSGVGRDPDMDNLANWPTPVNIDTVKINLSTLRPRRLTSVSDTTDVVEDSNTTRMTVEFHVDPNTPGNAILTNKTFEVKHENMNVSADALDASVSYGLTLNKTSTISTTPKSRPLAMIEEEDVINCGNVEAEKTYVKNREEKIAELSPARGEEDLLRDIKLVGTPLRKYSESMKDLSLRSPNKRYSASQGSMPNLNEMETIRSIEQNRYFYNRVQSQDALKMSVIQEQSVNKGTTQYRNEVTVSESTDFGLTSHVDLAFNQSEILAQSSRFNLNEVGLKSRKSSPVTVSGKWRDLRGVSPKSSRTKLIENSPSKSNGQKRNSQNLSSSDAQSNESLTTTANEKSIAKTCFTSAPYTRGSPNKNMSLILVSPPKRQRVEKEFAFERPLVPYLSRSKNWTHTQVKKVRIMKSTTPQKIMPPNIQSTIISRETEKLYDPELYLQFCINPDPFAASTTCDPFLACTMYLDEAAVQRHQHDFKKWLNALVTIPADMDANSDAKIDVGKLFNEVRHKELTLAPTKEEQSMDYLVQHRLEVVRRAAVYLYLSDEVREPCSKVAVYVNKNAIRIRNDRNLHLDVVMQRYILELLLCFNPMWLRIGLEVVYGEKIHLRSNSDIIGLSTFILNRLFRDKLLEEKYSRAYSLSEEYAQYIKKYTLTKMLCLLLFLDKAKQKRIIKYNPCLFVKKSPHKETKEILLKFSSELLANMGDITRDLKRLGYVLEHKQCFLDEFNYAFQNLAVDLRDGIRLTRVMEIILLREDLTKQLRVPAISRLQRIYNVNLGLRALSEADFKLGGDITAADIVDGHREKTLSLLWQVIYKFRSPKFHAAARVLQKWWRSKWLAVWVNRRIRDKEEHRRQTAAMTIQAYYHGYIVRRWVKLYRQQRAAAAVVLQKYIRRYLAQMNFKRSIVAVRKIQHWYRGCVLGVRYRRYYTILRCCTIFIQRCYRRRLLSKKLLLVANEYQRFIEEKRFNSATCIQRFWRSFCVTKLHRNAFLNLKRSALIIQRKWRAIIAMRQQRQKFSCIRAAVLYIQRYFRAKHCMLRQRAEFIHLRTCVVQLQRRRRSILHMRAVREEYKLKLKAVHIIQTYLRATLTMHRDRMAYQVLRKTVCKMQERYRAAQRMRLEKRNYQRLRNSCIIIQRKLRATILARQTRVHFLTIQYFATVMQQRFRATRLMKQQRTEFAQLKAAVVKVQHRYRSLQIMRHVRSKYQSDRNKIIQIQRRFRATIEMRLTRLSYQQKRNAVICIQNWYRSIEQTRQQQLSYIRLRNCCICVQRRWRALQQGRRVRQQYQQQIQCIISIQRRWRATLVMRKQNADYRCKRTAACYIQRFYRSYRESLAVRAQYLLLRRLVVCIQRRYRAQRNMRVAKHDFLLLRRITIYLQQKYRGLRIMHQQRSEFLFVRRIVLHLQQKFRGKQKTQQQRLEYLQLRNIVIGLQSQARGLLARRRLQNMMTPEMVEERRRRKAASSIQRFWRGYRVRKCFQSMQMRLIRRNMALWKKTTQAANTLSYKISHAVCVLRDHSSASEILHVLICLDRISRTVPHILMNQSDFVSTFCYGVMAQTIRSEVDKQLIRYCSRIILNLARYNSTTANTFQESGLVTIAQMLLRWCDKDSEIFNTLCTLIWLFAHCPYKRHIIREYMTTPEAIYVVRETKKLVARKERMNQNLRKPVASARVQKTQQFPNRALPSLEPDYGVIHSKPYTFVSSVFAFDMLLAELEIEVS
ncbi:protein abnormal spindle [Bactrocera neohumeralis]|uniref:protein abnormal spindle n=1 Tax=Bactrocera neohumeralis TaxID=98809 RepID=UPI0021651097|nr:protein abnormal spindle [Bactrocera neohumeralis]